MTIYWHISEVWKMQKSCSKSPVTTHIHLQYSRPCTSHAGLLTKICLEYKFDCTWKSGTCRDCSEVTCSSSSYSPLSVLLLCKLVLGISGPRKDKIMAPNWINIQITVSCILNQKYNTCILLYRHLAVYSMHSGFLCLLVSFDELLFDIYSHWY